MAAFSHISATQLILWEYLLLPVKGGVGVYLIGVVVVKVSVEECSMTVFAHLFGFVSLCKH